MSDEEGSGRGEGGGRFGPRYGRVGRKRVADIEDEMRRDHDCPECGEPKVSRTDTGIWECSKCGYRFTGGAYKVSTPGGEAVERAIREAQDTDDTDAATEAQSPSDENETEEVAE